MIHIKEKDPIPAGDNPFLHDLFNMGTRIGKNVIVMHGNHADEHCSYLIIVNLETGERKTVCFNGL